MERPTPKPAEEVKAVKARRQQKYKNNRQRVINHLKKRGLSNAAIAGIVGNIDVETGGSFDFQQRQTKSGKAHDPNFIKGGAYGLFQFDDPGKSAGHETWYKQYLEKTNKTDSAESQLDYVLDMVNAGENTQDPFYNFSTNIGASNAGTIKGYFKLSEDPKQVSDSITDRFLNPGVKHSDKRRTSAQATFDELQPVDPDNQNIDQAGDIVDTGDDVPSPETKERRFQNVPFLRHFFAEGGVPMKKQMEMFEQGGLRDEGGTVDPVSGNNVPPGSMQEEVRDDIPAQLSEGEFVFPADVVRYIGLGNLMSMRQEAKLGLQVMDKMGQMGNSEEATMPDNLPFDINDLDMADEPQYNVGGFVPGTPQQQQLGIAGYQQAVMPTTGFMQQQPVQFGQQQPMQAASQQFVQPTYTAAPQQAAVPTLPQYKPEEIPTFTQTIGQDPGQYDELRLYRNDAGAELRIPFKNGQPIYPIPEGYKFVDPDATKTEDTTVTPTTPQSTRVRQDDDGRTDAEKAEDKAIFDMQRKRHDIARELGLKHEGFGEGLSGTFGSGYLKPEMQGKVTGTGLIIGKNGVLIDPLTMSIHEQSGGGIIGGISRFKDKAGGLDTRPYSADFYEALPDDVAEAIVKRQADMERAAYADDPDMFGDGTDITSPVGGDFRIQDDDPGEDAGIRGTGRGEDSPSAARDFIASSARERAEAAARSRAALERTRPSYVDSVLSRSDPSEKAAAERAAARQQAEADANVASTPDLAADFRRRQQEDDDAAAAAARESSFSQDFSAPRTTPDTSSESGRGGGSSSRDFSAPSFSYGSGPRAKGGLIEKPKPKAKKKMKRGGLASKK